MATRHVLLIAADGLTALRCGVGAVEIEDRFPLDPNGATAFRDYLRRRDGALFQVLADTAEEDYRLELLPPASGRDRSALIGRKLRQHCADTPFAMVRSLGRLREGRRDERVLFVALSAIPSIAPWLDILLEREIAVRGLYSAAQAVAALAAGINAPPSRFLFVVLTRAGMRQTVIEAGQVRFSRLLPHSGPIEESATICAAEAARVHHYLVGQGVLTWDDALPVLILAHPGEAAAFHARCQDTETLRFQYPDLAPLAAKLGCSVPLRDGCVDILLAHSIAHHPPQEQFAPARYRRSHRTRQARIALFIGGSVLSGLCLLIAAILITNARGRADEIAGIRTLVEQDEQRYRDIAATMPSAPASPEFLRTLTNRYRELVRRSPGPQPALVHLSRALDSHPDIELDRLDWRISNHPDGQPIAPSVVPSSDNARGTADSPAFAVLDIQASLPITLASDPRAQQHMLDRFVASLRAEPSAQVRILNRPADGASSKTLRGDGDAVPMAAPRFALRVVQAL